MELHELDCPNCKKKTQFQVEERGPMDAQGGYMAIGICTECNYKPLLGWYSWPVKVQE